MQVGIEEQECAPTNGQPWDVDEPADGDCIGHSLPPLIDDRVLPGPRKGCLRKLGILWMAIDPDELQM